MGAGVYVTRNEQKAEMHSHQHGSNGVVIKLKVALGRYVEINEQAHPLQKTWMEHRYDSALYLHPRAPSGSERKIASLAHRALKSLVLRGDI